MCDSRRGRRGFKAWGSDCGCGCGTFFRRFISAKEKQERLEDYKEELKKELAGIEERIQELKAK